MTKKKALVGASVLFATILAGCGPGYMVGNYGPPPPPRYGAMGYAPGPGYVWTDGYYNLQGRNWAWVNGRWARPPRGHSAWVRPEWRHEGGRYRFHKGYWR
ncbi:MAG TPA: hypothetical protein VG456_22430 [Candidatus Sulfopaludibacter sp.]|jgi:hypothetical protein|nr:hypothetical protein [Candidatus Sulfopaludibacter sp.]